jgi:hypothetical protein
MEAARNFLTAIGTGAVAVALWLGLINMPRGSSPN